MEAMFPCKLCGKILPKAKYTPSMWKHRVERRPSCKDCADIAPTFPCQVCGKMLPEAQYSHSQWEHRVQRKATCN
eukprot:9356827-Karenia_brevis.AAC.1